MRSQFERLPETKSVSRWIMGLPPPIVVARRAISRPYLVVSSTGSVKTTRESNAKLVLLVLEFHLA